MRQIRACYPEENVLVAEAGAVLAEVQQSAADVDRLFPLSLASEGTAQIGGLLATNAGGVNVLRYGNAREQILGIEAVMPSGEVLSDLNGLRKNNTGYDLKQLLVGSEGTLGISTAAVLKLYPYPDHSATALVALRDLAHQPSDLVPARDHHARRRQGDGPGGAREGLQGAQDQHLHGA